MEPLLVNIEDKALAIQGEIKRAYRRIAFELHPDVGERPDAERFREAHKAYEVLSNPNRAPLVRHQVQQSTAAVDC